MDGFWFPSDFDLSPPSKIFASLTLSLRTSVHTPHLCSFLFTVTIYYYLGDLRSKWYALVSFWTLLSLLSVHLFTVQTWPEWWQGGREREGHELLPAWRASWLHRAHAKKTKRKRKKRSKESGSWPGHHHIWSGNHNFVPPTYGLDSLPTGYCI